MYVCNCQNYAKYEVAILHFLNVSLFRWLTPCTLKCQTVIARVGKSLRTQKSYFQLIFSSHLLQMAREVKTLPPPSEPQSVTGSYLLPACFS